MTSTDVIEALRTLTAPRRNNYFYGKRLDVPQFRMEQDYGKLKQWLLNRLSLGKGVLCGFDVAAQDGKLCIGPGVAIDGVGREVIHPLQTCIDPWDPPAGCCEEPRPPIDRNARRVMTLWVCYRECLTDMMPTLVSDCEIRADCAPGTIVETFSLKLTDGLPPELGDPTWCAALHTPPSPSPAPSASPTPTPAAPPASPTPTPGPGDVPWPADEPKSERQILCELLDETCCVGDDDPCVPLAAVLLEGGQITQIETCRYRPRIYSNAVLLDLILCLLLRVEECCGQQPEPSPTPSPSPSPTPSPSPSPSPTPSPTPSPSPPPSPSPTPPPVVETLRVREVTVLNAAGAVLDRLNIPGGEIQLPRTAGPAIIRVVFQGKKLDPATVVAGIPNQGADPNTFTFLVQGRGRYPANVTPGKIVSANTTTAQYRYMEGPFPQGRYTVTLFGTPDATVGRPTIEATDRDALDGEPAQLPSGDGSAGGNFVFTLTIA